MNPTIILAIFSVLGILYILYPIFFNKEGKDLTSGLSEGQRLDSLIEHKKSLFSSLRDLEFEYETGKISQLDFEKLREEYKTKVILIYRTLSDGKGN